MSAHGPQGRRPRSSTRSDRRPSDRRHATGADAYRDASHADPYRDDPFAAGSGPSDDFDRTREFDFGPTGPRERDRGRSGRGRGGRGGGSGSRRRPSPTEPHGPPPVPRRQYSTKERRPAWQRIAIAIGAAIAVVLVLTLGVRAAYAGKALPGTTLGGEDVGGKDEQELRAVVRELGNPDRRLVLTGAGKTLRVSAGGSGLEVDDTASVDRALDARRGNLFAPLLSFVAPAHLALAASIDRDELRGSVARVAGSIDRKPYAGALTIDPETLVVSTKVSAAGREVDREELADRLEQALLRPAGSTVEVPVESTKAVSAERVDEVAADAEQYLRTPLKLTGAGKTYTVEPADLAKLLALEPLDGGRKARLGVDAEQARALAQRVAAARDRAAKSASISAPSRGPVVDGKADVSWRPRKADVSVVSDGRSGVAVKVSELAKRIKTTVNKGAHSATVPTSTTKAPVNKASAAKIDRIIGTFTTYYIAGQPRVTNIKRIAKAVDRTVIAPGQTFSLNGISGERTTAKGYVEAPFIAGNKIEPSVGGGVSQFSTTMYNAAYFAGLQIDAHQPHSLFIDRYPAGRESTLNFPDIDMKWTNDTGVPVLIRTYADDAGVTVTLYGDNGGRRVEADPGSREPNPGGNFQITVTRVIRYPDGRVVRQPSTTKYANEVTEDAPQE